ncbi:MAG TPA: hypothetical protein PLO37_10840 [Candidatus Hydrogenedentes bacterium]|nr:hypothetical protein [Candidatus Hydrogenedentota bacterium]HPG67333.1 hypothetical protein [Candidatus Hydrogenedentota bacterium]
MAKKQRTPRAEPAAAPPEPEVQPPRGLPPGANRLALSVSAVVFTAFVAFTVVYGLLGTPVVSGLSDRLGEIMFERGKQFEAARQYENAILCYRRALECRFAGAQNRTFTLKRLGTLLYMREGPEVALEYLEEAYHGEDTPITLYAPLCESLIRAGRMEDVLEVAQRWFDEATAAARPDDQAQARYYEGVVYQKQGRHEKARETFLAGQAIRPGGNNAYELGVMAFSNHDYDEALRYLDEFLQGGTGGRAQYARQLRERILLEQVGKEQ